MGHLLVNIFKKLLNDKILDQDFYLFNIYYYFLKIDEAFRLTQELAARKVTDHHPVQG